MKARPVIARRSFRPALLALPLLVLAPGGAALAQPPHIGRLFTTDAERQRLDAQRMGTNVATSLAQSAPADQHAAPPPAPPAPLAVNGVVVRSGGQATVWINQNPQDGAVQVGPGGRAPTATVVLPNGARVNVKPGQQVDPVTGAIDNANQ